MKRLEIACVVCLAFAACGDLVDPAAAMVHGRKITVEEVRVGLEQVVASAAFQRSAEESDPDRLRRQFEQGHLATLIKRAVLRPHTEEFGIEVGADQIDTQIQLFEADVERQGGTLQEVLEEQGLTDEALRDLVRDQILEEAVREEVTREVTPAESEIRAYYEANREQASEMRAQHILVDREGLARRLAEQLRAADDVDEGFARLARRHSTDESSARDGGRLDFFGPGQLVPEFEQAAAELAIGEVSDPVESQFGWHVIRVLDRRELTLDEMRPQIAQELIQPLHERAWEEWLADAYKAAAVRINPRYGELDPRTGQIGDATAETIPGGEAPGTEPGAPPGFDELEAPHEDDHDH